MKIHHNEEEQTMKTILSRTGGRLAGIALALVLAGARPAAAATYTWNTGDGTWDDTTTANWSPASIPTNGDTVNLTKSSASDIAIVFNSTNFATGTNLVNGLRLWNTGGGTTTLTIAAGQILQYLGPANYDYVTVSNGGKYYQTGGFVSNTAPRGYLLVKGGLFQMTGGTFCMAPGGPCQVAESAGTTARVDIADGQLFIGNWGDSSISWYSEAGSSTLRLSGTGLISVSREFQVGNVGGTHVWTIDGGTMRAGYNVFNLGNNTGAGSVTVTQNAGTVFMYTDLLVKRTARYMMNGGVLRTANTYVGGLLHQTGGVLTNSYMLIVGDSPDFSGGTYKWEGGQLDASYNLLLGSAGGTGTFYQGAGRYVQFKGYSGLDRSYIGGTNGMGTYYIGDTNGPATNYFANYYTVGPSGTIRGHGKVQNWNVEPGGNYAMSGRIIADGYGVERDLDLTNCAGLTNPYDNTGDKGWFAINKGRLLLKPVALISGSFATNWGEAQDDTTIDLVNSARFVFSTVTGSGKLTGSLLSTNRSDVPTPPPNRTFLSVYDFSVSGISGYTYTLTIRYDTSLITPQRLDENTVKIWQYVGGNWVNCTDVIDTNQKLVKSNNRTGFSQFAVTADPPPAGTVILLK